MKKVLNMVFLLLPLNLLGDWVLQQSGVNNNLSDVYFVDAMHGWVAAGSDSGRGLILRTTDGGKNWEKVHTDSANIMCVGFFDSLEGWAGGQGPTNYYQMSSWAYSVLFHTTDGGQTWNKSKDMNSDEFRASTSLWYHFFIWIHRIHIVNSTYGFYMLSKYYEDNGSFYNMVGVHSLDGVHHWQDYNSFIHGLDLCFIDSLHGWVLKTDGGSNSYSQVLYIEKGIESLAVISVVDSSRYVMSGGSMDFVDSLHGWVILEKM
ncbi:MAG: hypothetical protein HY769_04700 [Candidatus Stahlbacteria bacterium]|nr:hypothetical protein [Candidatus Stahlbacteria bacterium]